MGEDFGALVLLSTRNFWRRRDCGTYWLLARWQCAYSISRRRWDGALRLRALQVGGPVDCTPYDKYNGAPVVGAYFFAKMTFAYRLPNQSVIAVLPPSVLLCMLHNCCGRTIYAHFVLRAYPAEQCISYRLPNRTKRAVPLPCFRKSVLV